MKVLKVSGLTKNFGGLAAVSNVNLGARADRTDRA